MKRIYTIQMSLGCGDPYESIASDFNRNLIDGIATHTSKRSAEKEMHRLQRQTEARNELRRVEGSRERKSYRFRIVSEET